jgi:excisionase family DNA binding protein
MVSFMNISEMLEEKCCGTTRASKLLQVSVGTIHHMVEKGELESWRTAGGHRRITLRSVRNCQLRRGLMGGAVTNYSRMNVVVLASQPESMMQFKSALSANVIPTSAVTYFTNPLQMVLELQSLTPQLLLLDKDSLEALGGISWFSQFRSHEKLNHVLVVMLCDKVDVAEASAMLINKVNVVTQPLDVAWLMGYVNALATSWELSCQI